MASKTRVLCEACGGDVGLWQAALTSECGHKFHLRCVSGSAACPECKVPWRDTPAVAPAPAPASPFSFASAPALFTQQSTGTAEASGFPSSPVGGQTSLPGSSPPTKSIFSGSSSSSLFGSSSSSLFGSSSPSLFSSTAQTTSSSSLFASGAQTTSSSFSFPLVRDLLPVWVIGRTIPSTTPSFGTSLFGPTQSATAAQSPSCSVCHSAMGRGQATVTSECNHTFHLRCFSGSVCPVCSVRWRDEVTVTRSSPFTSSPPQPSLFERPPRIGSYIPPDRSSSPPRPSLFHQPTSFTFAPPNPSPTPPMSSPPLQPSFSLFNFKDDEPVEPPLEGWDTVPEVAQDGVLVLKTHCEHPAVARDAAQENFAVLVHAKAPAVAAEVSERAPLDLVTVLDVSGSMAGSKLALLKQAMGFVIDKLGPGDRLSVVTFSCNACRIIRLTRMSDGGKASAKGAVESLRAGGTTNIGDGLRIAAQVLDDRRHKNAVSSVILLSDGQDNHTLDLGQGGFGPYGSLVDADGRAASVDVGELYAEEERRFLLLVDVPIAAGDGDVTRLIKASCTYKDAATGRSVDVAGEDAVVQRPVVVAAADMEPSMEVARERFRVETAEDIASARAAAERGEHAEAARILDRRREASAAAGLSGDARCAALAEELRELSARVANRREYEQTGRAFMLAGMSSHAQQRASTVQLFGSAAPPTRYGDTVSPGLFGTPSTARPSSAFATSSALSPFATSSMFSGAPAFSCTTPAFGAAAPSGSSSSAFPTPSGAGGFSSVPSGAGFTPSSPFVSATAPSFGAPAPCFSFGYATPAMQNMVDSSRRTREQQQQPEPATETKDGSLSEARKKTEESS
ncbi:hypothetical protein EJB05_18407, partial [Eragrostis curvula]